MPLVIAIIICVLSSVAFGFIAFFRGRYTKQFQNLQDGEVKAQLATGSRAPWRRIEVIAEGFTQPPFRVMPFEATGLLVFEADALRIQAVRLDGSRIDRSYPIAELSPERPPWTGGEPGDVWISLKADKPGLFLTCKAPRLNEFAGRHGDASLDLFTQVSDLARMAHGLAGDA